MGLPAQERFTLQDVADRLATSVHHVEELVCSLKFNYIITEDKRNGGSPSIQRIYFDQALFQRHCPGDRGWQSVLSDAEQLQQKAKLIEQIELSLAKQPKDPVIIAAAQRGIDRIQKGEPEEKTYCLIGPHQEAILWLSSQPWHRPSEDVTVYIPRDALEELEEKHAIHPVLSPKVSASTVVPMNIPQLDLSKMSESLRIAIMADIRLYSEGVIHPRRGDRDQINEWLKKEHPQLSDNARKHIISVVNRRKGGAPRFDEK